jgi:hypothetical protein
VKVQGFTPDLFTGSFSGDVHSVIPRNVCTTGSLNGSESIKAGTSKVTSTYARECHEKVFGKKGHPRELQT